MDESCTSNPKSQVVQFAFSDFGFEVQDSSNSTSLPDGAPNVL
jgi:hypothetical protein